MLKVVQKKLNIVNSETIDSLLLYILYLYIFVFLSLYFYTFLLFIIIFTILT